jgi:hypothetical protein
MYWFNHWDLHYHNLMVYVSPKKVNGRIIPNDKREVDVCFFDFDLAAVSKKHTNKDAYMNRLDNYIRTDHNLYQSYNNMTDKTILEKDTNKLLEKTNDIAYTQELFQLFEKFINTEAYTKYNLTDLNTKTPKELEIYFRYMGKIHDIIRMTNNIIDIPSIVLTKDNLQNEKRRSSTDEKKTNIECIIIFNLMKYINLNSHKRLAYGSILFTDFLLYLRERGTI